MAVVYIALGTALGLVVGGILGYAFRGAEHTALSQLEVMSRPGANKLISGFKEDVSKVEDRIKL